MTKLPPLRNNECPPRPPFSSVNSFGGGGLPAMAKSKSSGMLKMRRTLIDSYNETVRSAPKVTE